MAELTPVAPALPEAMRAVVCQGPGDYCLEEMPTPLAGPSEKLDIRGAHLGRAADGTEAEKVVLVP